MLPTSQHQQQQHQSADVVAQQQQLQQDAQTQHLLNVAASSYTTAVSSSGGYSMSHPVVTGHHLTENNNLIMYPSYGKPAAHVAHQLPPASLITLQPVPLDAHHHSALHHVSNLGPPPPGTPGSSIVGRVGIR
uniref:Uncharacterized protein n=1 Tax=Anopheles farauti TaxID=69004 RepID=A0A182Q6Q8_9DIPT